MSLRDLIRKGGLQVLATATPATVATGQGVLAATVATVAAVNVATATHRAATGPADLGSQAWPDSAGMIDAESDTLAVRLDSFVHRGLSLEEAERMAEELAMRDRDHDDRRLCVECAHLRGTGRWRCDNWQQAEVAIRPGDAQLPRELLTRLQRCPGFVSSSFT